MLLNPLHTGGGYEFIRENTFPAAETFNLPERITMSLRYNYY